MRRRATILTVTMTVASTALLWTGATPALAGGGCAHGTPPSDGSGTTVSMAENCFTPTVLHTGTGAEVTFRNDDAVEHTVTGVGFLWGATSDERPGDEVTYRFDEDGVYVYSCLLHPGMIGAIVVGDASGDAGLDAATVVAAPADAGGTTGTTTAPVDASSGTAWVSTALAAAAVVLIGLLGFVTLRRSRGSRVPTSA